MDLSGKFINDNTFLITVTIPILCRGTFGIAVISQFAASPETFARTRGTPINFSHDISCRRLHMVFPNVTQGAIMTNENICWDLIELSGFSHFSYDAPIFRIVTFKRSLSEFEGGSNDSRVLFEDVVVSGSTSGKLCVEVAEGVGDSSESRFFDKASNNLPVEISGSVTLFELSSYPAALRRQVRQKILLRDCEDPPSSLGTMIMVWHPAAQHCLKR